MKTIAALSLAALSLALGLAALPAAAQEPATASASMVDAGGKDIGRALLTETPHGVLITLELAGLPPGEHGFHIHETGACDPATFESAGAHYSPEPHEHGFKSAGGAHAGDLPNQFVAEDGSLDAEVLATAVTLSDGPATLLDADGSALVLHAGADDHMSQPSGGSGDRIACGVIAAD
jgi:Cu-Zn family superoxide dismutase